MEKPDCFIYGNDPETRQKVISEVSKAIITAHKETGVPLRKILALSIVTTHCHLMQANVKSENIVDTIEDFLSVYSLVSLLCLNQSSRN